MKKILLASSILAALTLVACGDKDEAAEAQTTEQSGNDVTGTYTASQGGITMELVYKADGTCSVGVAGAVMDDCTYSVEGETLTTVLMGQTEVATVKGGVITDNKGMVFTKQ